MSTSKYVILVTGASSGIGKATATHLSSKGHTVYGTGRSLKNLESINGFTGLNLDVTNRESVIAGVEQIIKRESKIDVLINNAGLGMACPIEESVIGDVDKVIATNVRGVLNTVKIVTPYLRQQQAGCIINITSIGSKFSLPFRGIYCASKYAVEAITESLSMELKQFNIKVCTLAPGDVASNINTNRLHSDLNNTCYSKYSSVLDQINNEVARGIKPIQIAKKIEHIIKCKRPLLHYKVATPTQRFSVVLKRLLPARWFEKLIMNHYNVK